MTKVLVESGPDQGLAWHFGNPLKEQKLLASGQAFVDLSNREIVKVSGPDRLAWLHSLTSQRLLNLEPGESTAALILDPNGRVEYVLMGVDDGEVFWAWTEPGAGDSLAEWLNSMKFMMKVEVTRPELRLIWAGAQLDVPGAVASRVSEIQPGGGEAKEYLVPTDLPLPEGEQAGVWAFEALRIAAGVIRAGVDTDTNTIPNEIGLFGTHLDKGCYRGQETVAKVHNLGRPPRRLVRLHLDGSMDDLPEPGDELRVADSSNFNDSSNLDKPASIASSRPIGVVSSSARHYELGPIGLALIKRDVPVDAVLVTGQISATQDVLVDPDVGLHIRPKPGLRLL